jgi:outer membrane protein TolC
MPKNRGLSWVLAAAVLAAGCRQPFYQDVQSYQHYNRMAGTYEKGSRSPDEDAKVAMTPATVRTPGNQKWLLTLADAKQLALQNNKQIEVVAYQPATADARIATELSVWDTVFNAGNGWGWQDRQVGSIVQSGLGNPVTASLQNLSGGQAGFGTSTTGGGATSDFNNYAPNGSNLGFQKQFATGGRASIDYSMTYQKLRPAGFLTVNPSWNSSLQFQIEQPLAQGSGVEFNRSRLLIARAQKEQQVATFAQNVQQLIRDVEVGYWQLYGAYVDYYAQKVALGQAYESWRQTKFKLDQGAASDANLAEAREQYENFRAETIRTLGAVLFAERQLRQVMGIPPEDGRRIITEDPVSAEYEPSFDIAVSELRENRADLVAQRFAIRAAEVELFRQKNGLLPDISVNGSWGVTGLDNQFDQSIDRLTDNQYSEWVLGIAYRRPIGERAAHAAVQNAKAQLGSARAQLNRLEHEAVHAAAQAYRNIVENYDRMQALLDQRDAAAVQLEKALQLWFVSKNQLDDVLRAQSRLATTTARLGQAVVQYNIALADWDFARGVNLTGSNVVLAEEIISCTGQAFKCVRDKELRAALPLPIHPGCKPPKEDPDCPPVDHPKLYPDKSVTPASATTTATDPNSGTSVTVPADPAEMAPAPLPKTPAQPPKNPPPTRSSPDAPPTAPATAPKSPAPDRTPANSTGAPKPPVFSMGKGTPAADETASETGAGRIGRMFRRSPEVNSTDLGDRKSSRRRLFGRKVADVELSEPPKDPARFTADVKDGKSSVSAKVANPSAPDPEAWWKQPKSAKADAPRTGSASTNDGVSRPSSPVGVTRPAGGALDLPPTSSNSKPAPKRLEAADELMELPVDSARTSTSRKPTLGADEPAIPAFSSGPTSRTNPPTRLR